MKTPHSHPPLAGEPLERRSLLSGSIAVIAPDPIAPTANSAALVSERVQFVGAPMRNEVSFAESLAHADRALDAVFANVVRWRQQFEAIRLASQSQAATATPILDNSSPSASPDEAADEIAVQLRAGRDAASGSSATPGSEVASRATPSHDVIASAPASLSTASIAAFVDASLFSSAEVRALDFDAVRDDAPETEGRFERLRVEDAALFAPDDQPGPDASMSTGAVASEIGDRIADVVIGLENVFAASGAAFTNGANVVLVLSAAALALGQNVPQRRFAMLKSGAYELTVAVGDPGVPWVG